MSFDPAAGPPAGPGEPRSAGSPGSATSTAPGGAGAPAGGGARGGPGAPGGLGRPRAGVAVAVAVVVAVVAWLLLRGGGGGHSRPAVAHPARGAPSAATPAELQALPRTLKHQVYWAGPAGPTDTLEQTRFSDGSDWIRYLPRGRRVGAPDSCCLTVASYVVPNARGLAEQGARRPGATVVHLHGGGLAVSQPEHPQSVYYVAPGSSVLVEVYDPSAAHAMSVVRAGRIVPLG